MCVLAHLLRWRVCFEFLPGQLNSFHLSPKLNTLRRERGRGRGLGGRGGRNGVAREAGSRQRLEARARAQVTCRRQDGPRFLFTHGCVPHSQTCRFVFCGFRVGYTYLNKTNSLYSNGTRPPPPNLFSHLSDNTH